MGVCGEDVYLMKRILTTKRNGLVMKKISLVIPCYNEEANIDKVYGRIREIFERQLPGYSYEFLFIDNDSTDGTKRLLTELARADDCVRVIFNAKNFGWVRSSIHGLMNASGDAVIYLAADMQEPPELIPQFVAEWESGHKIVIGIKNKSRESPIMWLVRSVYYKAIKLVAEIEHIDHFTGFGLYDRRFIEVLRDLNDPMPYLRGIVAELGYKHKKVYFEQEKRKAGKSKFNFFRLYDFAMLGVTSYTKTGLRLATICGFLMGGLSSVAGLVYLVYKLLDWDKFSTGMAPVVIGVFFIGSLQLFFIGLIGEYIMAINTRLMNRPLVIEEERINFGPLPEDAPAK
jgi:glycosyltransferase involved in cell wall biosynthesis